jgi:hypothetical protein
LDVVYNYRCGHILYDIQEKEKIKEGVEFITFYVIEIGLGLLVIATIVRSIRLAFKYSSKMYGWKYFCNNSKGIISLIIAVYLCGMMILLLPLIDKISKELLLMNPTVFDSQTVANILINSMGIVWAFLALTICYKLTLFNNKRKLWIKYNNVERQYEHKENESGKVFELKCKNYVRTKLHLSKKGDK